MTEIKRYDRAGCLTLIVFLLLCGCLCSVSLSRGAMDWSVIVAFPGRTHLVKWQDLV